MKKIYLFIICYLLCQTGFSQNFSTTWGTGATPNIAGWTYATGTSFINGSAFELTQNIGDQAGYIYYATPENLATCSQFTVDFQFQIIGTAGYNTIADGIAFWYITNPPTGFTNGGGIGLPQFANGLIMIMDTYDNDGNHNNPLETLLGFNGSEMGYNEPQTVGLINNQIVANQSFIDDGSWHECKITYNNGNINVYFNGSLTPSMTGSYPLNITGYFGFSASTGAVSSVQNIRYVTISGVQVPPAPTAPSPVVLCQYAPADTLTVTTGTNLTWYSLPADTVLPGSPTPNTSIADTTYYAVTQGGTGVCASQPDTIQVIVNPQPGAPVITGDTTYCNGATFVPFNVTGSGILWYTSDTGTGSATAPTVNTSIAGAYKYYASQTVNGCISAKDSITVVVYPVTAPPTIGGGPTTYCYGTPFVPFTVSGQNVVWTDASGDTTSVTPVINTSSAGTYTYTVTQTINGCISADTTVQVTVYPVTLPPTVTDTSFCAQNGTVTFVAQGADLLWYTTITGDTGTATAPVISLDSPGVFTYYVSQTLNECESARTPVTVTVNPGVTTGFTYMVHYGCRQDTVVFTNTSTGATLYSWYFGDGYTDTGENPTHIYTSQGTYIVTLFAANLHCSDSTVIDTITISHPLQASFLTSADTICQGQTINFYNTSIGTQPVYFWDFGDGFGSITDSTSHTFTLAGVFTVKLEENDFIPCFDTAYKTVFVDSMSAISFAESDTALCAGKAITFTGNYSNIGNIGNMWTFGDGSTVINTNPINHAYDTSGVMTVTLTANYRVCPDTSITKDITIKPYPELNLGPDTSICPNSQPISLNDLINAGNPLAHWLWNTGDTTSGILVASPAVYYATVTINGCSTSDSVWVKNNCYINIPNAFTPNGDGVNDYFFPRQLLTSGATDFKMEIYNRWGQQIFETNSTDGRGWDGRFNGEMQPQGVYIYIIDVSFQNGASEHFQGNVTLLQ